MKIRFVKFIICALLMTGAFVPSARADLFSNYAVTGNTFTVPSSAYDVSGGLLYYVSGDTLYRQNGFNVNGFTAVGHLGGTYSSNDFPSFVEFSPDGSRVAIGNGGGADFGTYQVAVFNTSLLNGSNPDVAASASIYGVGHYSAIWKDNAQLFLTAGAFGSPGVVTKLDTTSSTASPVNPTIINNIGGASAGIAFNSAGDLFTGNGFDGAGASDIGWIKMITASAWQGSPPIDFESSPASKFVVDLLSANSLAFDSEGNLLVGGGDFGTADNNYFALVSSGALNNLFINGIPINVNDPLQVRKFDPSTGFSFYSLAVDGNNNYFYALDGSTAYQYCAVPEPEQSALMAIGIGLVILQICQSKRRRQKHGKYILSVSAGVLLLAGIPAHAGQFFANEVVDFSPGTGITEGVGFGITSRVLGGPTGGGASQGSTDVLSLGEGGSVTLGFEAPMANLPGPDFIVFENPIQIGGNPHLVFAELFFVEVSSNGTDFARFDNRSLNPGPIGPFNGLNPNLALAFGGTSPVYANVDTNTIDPFDPTVAGGNGFDLQALTNSNNALVLSGDVDLSNIRYIRLIDIKGDGATLDTEGNPIYDATGFSQSADIDAIAIIYGVPEPGTLAMYGIALTVGIVLVRRRKQTT